MTKRPNKSVEFDGKATSKEKVLRRKVAELEREVTRLKAQLRSADQAFSMSAKFMSTKAKRLSPEDLIAAARSSMSLEETIEEVNNSCKNELCESPDVFKGFSIAGTLHICRTCKTRWMEREEYGE